MDTTKRTRLWTKTAVTFAATITFVVGFAPVANAAAEVDAQSNEEERVTQNSFFADDGRDQTAPNKVSKDTKQPLSKSNRTNSGTRGSQQQKSLAKESRTPNTDFWFFDADVELFADNDRDGYFHGIDLLFDADTFFVHADVYAVVYLSFEGEAWIEYAETETFSIFGQSGNDEYVIVSELVAGYPTGSYDILIELFDAFDDSFVADFGPDNTSELSLLPLEDSNRDSPGISPTPIVVNHGGGGATDLSTIALLALLMMGAVAFRRR